MKCAIEDGLQPSIVPTTSLDHDALDTLLSLGSLVDGHFSEVSLEIADNSELVTAWKLDSNY